MARIQKSAMRGDYLEDLGAELPATGGHWGSGSKPRSRPTPGGIEVWG